MIGADCWGTCGLQRKERPSGRNRRKDSPMPKSTHRLKEPQDQSRDDPSGPYESRSCDPNSVSSSMQCEHRRQAVPQQQQIATCLLLDLDRLQAHCSCGDQLTSDPARSNSTEMQGLSCSSPTNHSWWKTAKGTVQRWSRCQPRVLDHTMRQKLTTIRDDLLLYIIASRQSIHHDSLSDILLNRLPILQPSGLSINSLLHHNITCSNLNTSFHHYVGRH